MPGHPMVLASTHDPRLDDGSPAADPSTPAGVDGTPAAPLAPSTSARLVHDRRHHPRVLVVEDDATCRRGICRNLRLAGYEVLSAADGVEALAAIEEHGTDIIVTDLMMPNMDGVDLILSVAMATPRVPIIAITGTDDSEGCIKAARQFGAERVFRKPFGSQNLLTAIAAALEG